MKKILLLLIAFSLCVPTLEGFSKGSFFGGMAGGLVAGGLIGSAITKRRYRRGYYNYPPCAYNYCGDQGYYYY